MEGNGVHKRKMKGVLWGTNKNFNRIRDFTVIGKCLYKNSEPFSCFPTYTYDYFMTWKFETSILIYFISFSSKRRFSEEKNKADENLRKAEEKVKVKREIEVGIRLINLVITFALCVCAFYSRMHFQYWFVFLSLLMGFLETNL